MTIVVTGGGSGGHITPILAVAHELKQLDSKLRIIYIGQIGDSLGDIPAEDKNIDQVFTVYAGKFRRYHGEGWKQLLDLRTMALNLRDAFRVLVGLWQSFHLLGKLKPDVLFVKGGFVGVPVGLAAAVRRIPFVTHDSDAIPGLANRIIARWAKLHAVALPKEVYAYPTDKTVTVGVPIAHHFHPVTAKEVSTERARLQLEKAGRVLLVTGGGLGALRLNQSAAACMPELLERYRDLYVVHLAGRPHEAAMRQFYKQHLPAGDQKRVMVKGFITNLHQYSAAADVVLTRAGGTSMAEFAAQAKACVVVPNPLLTGGHQLKNAEVLAGRKAVRLVQEKYLQGDHRPLMAPLTELLDDPKRAKQLGERLAELAQPDAAHRLAVLLLETAGDHRDRNIT